MSRFKLAVYVVVGLGLSACAPPEDTAAVVDRDGASAKELGDRSYVEYDPSWAAQYAHANWDRAYGSDEDENPFYDYDPDAGDGEGAGGGNCTNFVSQAILGGLIGSDDAHDAYNARTSYAVDSQFAPEDGPRWFWINADAENRGDAFTGANSLKNYASGSLGGWTGLNFSYVGEDTLTEFFTESELNGIQVGDIILADLPEDTNGNGEWDSEDEPDGVINHSMIVTKICDSDESSCLRWWGYHRVRVTYQSSNRHNKSLGWFNDEYAQRATFEVYRPEYYTDEG